MQRWHTPDGSVLVEGPAAAPEIAGGFAIQAGSGRPLAIAHDYYLLDADGQVQQVFLCRDYSLDDYLYGWAYQVAGGELREYFNVIRVVFGDPVEYTLRRELPLLTGLDTS